MNEAKVLEALRLIGGLEYLISSHVENLAVRDTLIAKINELEKVVRGEEEDTQEVEGDVEDSLKRDCEELHPLIDSADDERTMK